MGHSSLVQLLHLEVGCNMHHASSSTHIFLIVDAYVLQGYDNRFPLLFSCLIDRSWLYVVPVVTFFLFSTAERRNPFRMDVRRGDMLGKVHALLSPGDGPYIFSRKNIYINPFRACRNPMGRTTFTRQLRLGKDFKRANFVGTTSENGNRTCAQTQSPDPSKARILPAPLVRCERTLQA